MVNFYESFFFFFWSLSDIIHRLQELHNNFSNMPTEIFQRTKNNHAGWEQQKGEYFHLALP